MSAIRDNIDQIRERIAQAAARAGRKADEITLMGVSKRQPDTSLIEAYEAGLRDFGENTVQELTRKAALLSDQGFEPRWHFIGHLQRNKINALLDCPIHRIHSIGTAKLARALDKRAPEGGVDVLVEVNVGVEEQKGGVVPDGLRALLDSIDTCDHLRLTGLMAIPPSNLDPRPFFDDLVKLRERHQDHPALSGASELSIGMSADFETAIECGSTIVRVGTAIFGPRPN